MTLKCPVLYVGPSAVNVKPVHGFGTPPASVEGKAWHDAAEAGDFTEAGRIGIKRTLDKFAGISFSKEVPGGEKRPLVCVSSGACLEPYINDGDTLVCDVTEPKEGNLVAFHIKGQPADFMLAKMFLKAFNRGNIYVDAFGDDQPDRIRAVLQTNPMAICLIAERDIDFWRRIPVVIRGDKGPWEVDQFPLSGEQREALRVAWATPTSAPAQAA